MSFMQFAILAICVGGCVYLGVSDQNWYVTTSVRIVGRIMLWLSVMGIIFFLHDSPKYLTALGTFVTTSLVLWLAVLASRRFPGMMAWAPIKEALKADINDAIDTEATRHRFQQDFDKYAPAVKLFFRRIFGKFTRPQPSTPPLELPPGPLDFPVTNDEYLQEPDPTKRPSTEKLQNLGLAFPQDEFVPHRVDEPEADLAEVVEDDLETPDELDEFNGLDDLMDGQHNAFDGPDERDDEVIDAEVVSEPIPRISPEAAARAAAWSSVPVRSHTFGARQADPLSNPDMAVPTWR